MRKSFKIVIVLILFLLMVNFLVPLVNAYDWEAETASMLSNSTKYDSQGASESTQKIVGAIITIARVIATGIAIIMLIVVAIKYMSSAPGDRAEIKKHAVTYIVGAVVLFATSGLLTIIANFASSIGK